MANEHSSSVVMRMPGNQSSALFPKELRRGLFTQIDKRFALILAICGFVIFSFFAILSLRKPSMEVSEKEITQIQERYARLVLNQEKPEVKVEEAPKSTVTTPEKTDEIPEEEIEKPEVEREKETFVEKQKRKETGVEERRQIRDEVAKQIQSSGIFAAITAAGNSGGSGVGVSDLLGNVTQGTADLGSITVSKGSFASKQNDTVGLTTKKGEATTGIDIERQNIARTEVTRVASSGAVNITSQAPEVSGQSSSHADRTQSAIQRVVNRETQRLKRVYEDWLKRDPALSGSLTVKFVILPSGAVSNVTIIKTSTNNNEFNETILRYIKRWQFPAVPESGPVEVVYPFVFEGQS